MLFLYTLGTAITYNIFYALAMFYCFMCLGHGEQYRIRSIIIATVSTVIQLIIYLVTPQSIIYYVVSAIILIIYGIRYYKASTNDGEHPVNRA